MTVVYPSTSSPLAATLVAPAECDSVVCFAAVDWWYHNRGHSECQIMKRLARRVPVLWVNSIGLRAPSPGKTELPLRRYVRKFKSTLKGLRRDESGMHVYSPIFLPRYSPAAIEFNARLVRAQVRFILRRIGARRPAVWSTIPTAAPIIEKGPWRTKVCNRCDDFGSFPEVNAAVIRPLEQRLLVGSDVTLFASRGLYERERPLCKEARCIGHGVDFEHFARPRNSPLDPKSAAIIKDLPRPIIGFYGALDDYTVDLELLIKVAQRFPAATLLIMGPKAMDIRRLEALPNVRYTGPIPYESLPQLASHFDVALMPWLNNDWIKVCNPIKLKEYLALGFPIVSTRFNELAPYERLLYAADTHEQFLDQIAVALAENNPALPAARRAAVEGDSWDTLADRCARWLKVVSESPA